MGGNSTTLAHGRENLTSPRTVSSTIPPSAWNPCSLPAPLREIQGAEMVVTWGRWWKTACLQWLDCKSPTMAMLPGNLCKACVSKWDAEWFNAQYCIAEWSSITMFFFMGTSKSHAKFSIAVDQPPKPPAHKSNIVISLTIELAWG